MAHDKGHDHGPVEYRFCPRCGGELALRKVLAGAKGLSDAELAAAAAAAAAAVAATAGR